ncbi:FAD:protein FMN transferase [Methylorubrum sp. SB2]|uniref:FAD:protein FMN transferase n=1 Tax=Methylorubrum subtropicum TaxID=3138812 RepID=UPI00313BEA78
MNLPLRPAPERRRALLGGLGALAALATGPAAFRALAESRGRRTATRAGLAFGTTVSLTLVAEREAAFEPAFRDAFAAIHAVEAAGSLYRSDSALSRLNRDGRLDAPDPLLLTMLHFALTLAERSGGAFDPTVQPLWTLWSESAAKGERPGPQARAEAVTRIGWHHVAADESAIRFTQARMGLTLNGLIQGFAADRVMAALAAHGIADAFVDTGEFAATGAHADGTPWRLGLGAHGDAPSDIIAPFAGFAATSGDDATVFSPDRRDHHIFDPATGLSPTALSRVTVTAPSGLLADGLSTAAFVMGEAAGAALVRLYEGCGARFTAKL